MSNHDGPEGVAPDELRCEALVKSSLHPYYKWQGRDRRCSRRANQTREGFAVCYIHAQTKIAVDYRRTLPEYTGTEKE